MTVAVGVWEGVLLAEAVALGVGVALGFPAINCGNWVKITRASSSETPTMTRNPITPTAICQDRRGLVGTFPVGGAAPLDCVSSAGAPPL